MKTLCFTGHRPKKLGGYDWMNSKNLSIMRSMRIEIINSINHGVNSFIFGGSIGIDQMAFAVVLKLKKEKFPNIKLTIAVPFKNQWVKWNKEDQIKYRKQLSEADDVVFIDELKDSRYYCTLAGLGNYHIDKMDLRNQYMVDNSDYIMAIWDGTSSGTGNCIRYAVENGFELGQSIIHINPRKIN